MLKNITVSLLGDLMLGGDFSEKFEQIRNSWIPIQIQEWLNSDIVFANLESPASYEGKRTSINKVSLLSNPVSLHVLRDIGVNFVNLANNHMMDFGYEAVEETKRILDNFGIKYAGCGQNLSDARKPAILYVKNSSVSIHCYSLTKEFIEPVIEATDSSPGVSPIDVKNIVEDVISTKNNIGIDFSLISLHWGEGKTHYPQPEQIDLAHYLIDSGVDIVIGTHTHCLQGFESYKGKAIFYALGNFMFSPYKLDIEKRISNDPSDLYTYPYKRERRTAVFRVTLSNIPPKASTIDYLPLIQDKVKPILFLPKTNEQKKIKKILSSSSSKITNKHYKKLIFPFARRFDEIQRIVEDIQEEGLNLNKLHPKTILRTIKNLRRGNDFGYKKPSLK